MEPQGKKMKAGLSSLHKCDKCELNFLSKEGMEKHSARVHEGKAADFTRYKCEKCKSDFKSKPDFKQHKLPAKAMGSCTVCQKAGKKPNFVNICEYTAHRNEHEKEQAKYQNKCVDCKTEFSSGSLLEKHTVQRSRLACGRAGCREVLVGDCRRIIHWKNHAKTAHNSDAQRSDGKPPTSTSKSPNSPVLNVNRIGSVSATKLPQTHLKAEEKPDTPTSLKEALIKGFNKANQKANVTMMPQNTKTKGSKDSSNPNVDNIKQESGKHLTRKDIKSKLNKMKEEAKRKRNEKYDKSKTPNFPTPSEKKIKLEITKPSPNSSTLKSNKSKEGLEKMPTVIKYQKRDEQGNIKAESIEKETRSNSIRDGSKSSKNIETTKLKYEEKETKSNKMKKDTKPQKNETKSPTKATDQTNSSDIHPDFLANVKFHYPTRTMTQLLEAGIRIVEEDFLPPLLGDQNVRDDLEDARVKSHPIPLMPQPGYEVEEMITGF